MPLTELEVTSAAATIASTAMDAAEAAATTRFEEAAICERIGQQLIARCNVLRTAETKLALTFAEKEATKFAEHRQAEAAKTAAEVAQRQAIEASNAKVGK